MDILADLAGQPRRSPGVDCAVSRLRRDNPELAAQLDRALPSQYTNREIADWFAERNVDLDEQMIGRHRRGDCKRCRTTS